MANIIQQIKPTILMQQPLNKATLTIQTLANTRMIIHKREITITAPLVMTPIFTMLVMINKVYKQLLLELMTRIHPHQFLHVPTHPLMLRKL